MEADLGQLLTWGPYMRGNLFLRRITESEQRRVCQQLLGTKSAALVRTYLSDVGWTAALTYLRVPDTAFAASDHPIALNRSLVKVATCIHDVAMLHGSNLSVITAVLLPILQCRALGRCSADN